MFQTNMGPVVEEGSTVYLRPETAQGIFVNFKNVYQSARKRPPFGIAQIGKAFRNEITPGNFTYRLREFEQAELEYFVPDDGQDLKHFEEWVQLRKGWYSKYGINAYGEEKALDPAGKETERVVLHFHPSIAPVQAAVFSLARNKPELVELARSIEAGLRPRFRTQYDEGNIGQLYRRQDEIGTPF